MMNVDMVGNIGFTSYRDPNIDRTNKVYDEVVDYIKALNPNDEELLKYKIGAIGSSEVVLHVSDKAELARNHYLRGLSYEARAKNRYDLLNVTKEELIDLAKSFSEALSDNALCVIGNSKKIEESKIEFKNIRNLIN